MNFGPPPVGRDPPTTGDKYGGARRRGEARTQPRDDLLPVASDASAPTYERQCDNIHDPHLPALVRPARER